MPAENNALRLSRAEIMAKFNQWLLAWDAYELENVMTFIHDDVVFENWDGTTLSGKSALKRIWAPWFVFGRNFRFIKEDVFVDEYEQKITFQWRLEWPSRENECKGLREIRRGVDLMYLRDGAIIKKISYSKTNIEINGVNVALTVQK